MHAVIARDVPAWIARDSLQGFGTTGCRADPKVIHVDTGHGILWDGYRNEDLERLICDFYTADKTIATCSHGAVALLGVKVTECSSFRVRH